MSKPLDPREERFLERGRCPGCGGRLVLVWRLSLAWTFEQLESEEFKREHKQAESVRNCPKCNRDFPERG